MADLDFLTVDEDDVRRWDVEWLRYFRKSEAPSYFTRYEDLSEEAKKRSAELRGLTRFQMLRAKGNLSHINLWYDAADLVGKKVAEIGCGVGRVAREVAPICAEYVGIDYSELALYIASRTSPGRCYFVSLRDKKALSRLKGTRDTIVFRNFFIHQPIEEARWVLQLASYLLRPGGVSVLDLYSPDERHAERVKNQKATDARAGRQRLPSMLFVYEKEEILSLLEQSSLVIEDEYFDDSRPRRYLRVKKQEPPRPGST